LPQTDLSRAAWRKSTYSSQNGACVEVARNLPRLVAIRDSKHPDTPALLVTSDAWQTFIQGLGISGERRAV
jgi:predicted secreted Zn-dependent protease